SSESFGDEILHDLAALQRPLAEMALENAAQEPSRGFQAIVVVQPLGAQGDQLAAPVDLLLGDAIPDAPRTVLGVVEVTAVGIERLAAVELAIELETVPERTQQTQLEQAQHARHARRGGQAG